MSIRRLKREILNKIKLLSRDFYLQLGLTPKQDIGILPVGAFSQYEIQLKYMYEYTDCDTYTGAHR